MILLTPIADSPDLADTACSVCQVNSFTPSVGRECITSRSEKLDFGVTQLAHFNRTGPTPLQFNDRVPTYPNRHCRPVPDRHRRAPTVSGPGRHTGPDPVRSLRRSEQVIVGTDHPVLLDARPAIMRPLSSARLRPVVECPAVPLRAHACGL